MKLNNSNLYIKSHGEDEFVVCIEMPDNSRNFMHSQSMILGDCIHVIDELNGLDIPSDANEPYLESDETYYRIKMTIEPHNLSLTESLFFHSRKLNLNDAVRERQMLLTKETNCEDKS